MPKNKSYHFSLGNSSTGPIGFCARVTASNKADAIKQLQNRIEDLGREMSAFLSDNDGSEYLNVYFNPDAITVRAIDEIAEVDEFEEESGSFRHQPNHIFQP